MIVLLALLCWVALALVVNALLAVPYRRRRRETVESWDRFVEALRREDEDHEWLAAMRAGGERRRNALENAGIPDPARQTGGAA